MHSNKSNFSAVPLQWQSIAASAIEAEQNVHRAPLYAAMLCRKSLEEWIRWIYEHDSELEMPYDDSLNALMHQQSFKELIAPNFFPQLNTIRKLGNDAVHTGKKINTVEAMHVLKLLHGFIFWVVNVYGKERVTKPPFDESIIPSGDLAEKTREELCAIEDAYQQSTEKLKKIEAELEAIKAIKTGNIETVLPPIDPDESLTRKIYINSLLREAGWDPFGKNVVEYPVKGMPTAKDNSGDGKVDYVLWGDDGKPLAVVEAKRTRRDSRVGQNQAKLYANCLETECKQRPFIFYTNGFETWFWDDTEYAPRQVYGFYTKDEMQTLVNRRSLKLTLAGQPISLIADRYYQHEAIRAVTETFEKKKREALLVMATGTGKTRTAAALIDLLSKAGWAKRILFLADRNALIHQAKVNLNDYLPHMPAVDLTKEKEDESSRIIFSTYQTLINQIDGEFNGDNRYYGVGHFDLIIFDEIHRSVYNRYKYIFKYFDGFRLGLTATPKSETDRDTYALFEMEPNNPTYAYELEQAINDRFLVPPKAISVPVKFHREGIKYADLSDDEKSEYEEQFTDPITGNYPDEIEATALNQWLFNEDTVDKIIAHLMSNGVKVEGGDKIGKTIIFARSHKHAKYIEERFNINYPQYKGAFLSVIDYQEEYTFDLLNKFKSKEKMPQIAVSIDMLDTGIDIPEVVNLVFFKPVRSSVKYWQMIGRGTRLCPDLFAVGEDKTHFIIFDFCENFEYFGNNPKGVEGVSPKSISQRLFEIRLKLAHLFSSSADPELQQYSKDLFTFIIKQTQALNLNSFIVRQHQRVVEKYCDPAHWNALNTQDIKEIIDNIAHLVIESDVDEMAKRFDLIMYDMQVFTDSGDTRVIKLSDKIIKTAAKLTKQTRIPAVAQKIDILNLIQQSVYWENSTVLGLEKLRIEIRDLIKFIEKESQSIFYSDYEDSFGVVKEHTLGFPVNDREAYRRKVEKYIIAHKNHITIHKLNTNVPITIKELEELERMLFEQGELDTKETFIQAFGDQPLGKFIRSIIGLDINAAKTAFASLLQGNTLNSTQIRFIDTIINYLIVNGTIESGLLFEPPFTDIDTRSIVGLFDVDACDNILSIIESINHNAQVA